MGSFDSYHRDEGAHRHDPEADGPTRSAPPRSKPWTLAPARLAAATRRIRSSVIPQPVRMPAPVETPEPRRTA
jgi:hypothetical protein